MPIVNCEWFIARLESFLLGQMAGEEKVLSQAHVESCSSCRQEVAGFEEVDRRVRAHFRSEVTQALKTPALSWRRPAWALALAGSVVLGVTFIALREPPPGAIPATSEFVTPEASEPAAAAGPAVETKELKEGGTVQADRAKPATTGVAPTPPVELPNRRPFPSGGSFLISDQAGFSRDLSSYAGYVVVFARLSASERVPLERFEELYSTFGGNPRLRIVGIFDAGTGRPAGATFPIGFNLGSSLLDAEPGELVVVDVSGGVRLRESLLQDSGGLVKTLSATLERLGAR